MNLLTCETPLDETFSCVNTYSFCDLREKRVVLVQNPLLSQIAPQW